MCDLHEAPDTEYTAGQVKSCSEACQRSMEIDPSVQYCQNNAVRSRTIAKTGPRGVRQTLWSHYMTCSTTQVRIRAEGWIMRQLQFSRICSAYGLNSSKIFYKPLEPFERIHSKMGSETPIGSDAASRGGTTALAKTSRKSD